MSLEHTLVERPDVASFLAETEPPPMSEELREATADLARQLAGAWSHGALPPGVKLGPYTIQGPLGQGGQATVYRAEDEAGQSFAIKVPRQELLARLVREAQILFHLDHPRVVRIITADVKGTPPYLVTEHLSGGTLADVLEAAPGRRLRAERVRELGLAVLEALAYAHEKGVIHRDLKPSNILFDAGGEAKVADFGIGTLSLVNRLEGTLVSHDRTGVAGTPLYMAPEQELASATVDARADLYALGKVIYRALTGRSPRTIRPLRRVLPDLDEAWEDFILNLVEDDPQERYPSAEQARAVLAQLPLEDPLPTPPVERAHPVLPELAQLPPSESPDAASPEAERAPWATGYVVDQMLALAQRLAQESRGGLFAFVPQPWEPGTSLGGVRSAERSLAELEDVLAIDPLGIALRGRTIRATFDPRGADSRQAWLEAALAEHMGELLPDPETPPHEVFLVGVEASLVAQVGSGTGDWLPVARAAQAGQALEASWIAAGVDDDHLLLARVSDTNPHYKQRALERLSWLAQRVALVLAPGDLWRHVSPGPAFDTVQRNWLAQDLASRGSLVLHVEPSGRWLVYSGHGMQSTRSVAYLRRLLEGGLGFPAARVEAQRLETQAPRPRRRWPLPLTLSLCAATIPLLLSHLLSTLDLGLGLLASGGLGYCAWELQTEGHPTRKVFSLLIALMVIGIAVSLIPAALG